MSKEQDDSRLGRYVVISTVGDEKVNAFIPPDLPPFPAVKMDSLYKKLGEADRAIGKLDAMVTILPNTPLFLSTYAQKEALLSSQIEGTQSSLSDLLLFGSRDKSDTPKEDTEEVANYIIAMYNGLEKIKDDFPLSLKLMREMHQILLSGSRGSTKLPGEFRRSQNWIGGNSPIEASYVPPPSSEILDLMSKLEKFINEDNLDVHPLIKAGLVHVQFESIHPFLDGNGRLGRLLITLLFCKEGILKEPILYLSYFFKKNRSTYYELIQKVRTENGWEKWIEFFLDGIIETSNQAINAATEIMKMFNKDEEIIKTLGRNATVAHRVHEFMKRNPIFRMSAITRDLEFTRPTIQKAIKNLIELGLVSEFKKNPRNRVYIYTEYMYILSQGADPIK